VRATAHAVLVHSVPEGGVAHHRRAGVSDVAPLRLVGLPEQFAPPHQENRGLAEDDPIVELRDVGWTRRTSSASHVHHGQGPNRPPAYWTIIGDQAPLVRNE